jgi:hypothetical protein
MLKQLAIKLELVMAFLIPKEKKFIQKISQLLIPHQLILPQSTIK